MKKKPEIKIQQKQFKIGRPLKEVVPPFSKEPRDYYIGKIDETLTRDYKCLSEPSEIFPEWPGNEEAKVMDNIFYIRILTFLVQILLKNSVIIS